MAGANRADAVANIDTIEAADAFHGPPAGGENDRLALFKGYRFASRLGLADAARPA